MGLSRFAAAVLFISLIALQSARAAVTFSAFTPAGTLSGKTLTTGSLTLATPTAGTPNNGAWLLMYTTGSSGTAIGLGSGITKVGAATPGSVPADNEIIDATISGLTPGVTYSLQFDVLFGASWDGIGGATSPTGAYGPDYWRFTVNGTPLIDANFSNVSNGGEPNKVPGDTYVDAGAYSPQTYSDATPIAAYSATARGRFTGADTYFVGSAPNTSSYADIYSIYNFGNGAGNPTLTFMATGSTASLEWARYSGSSDSADEFWSITGVALAPEPASTALFSAAAFLFLARSRRP